MIQVWYSLLLRSLNSFSLIIRIMIWVAWKCWVLLENQLILRLGNGTISKFSLLTMLMLKRNHLIKWQYIKEWIIFNIFFIQNCGKQPMFYIWHLLADRDWRSYHHPSTWRHPHQARLGLLPLLWGCARDSGWGGEGDRGRGRGLHCVQTALAR